MRKLLRDGRSRVFLAADGSWTTELTEAMQVTENSSLILAKWGNSVPELQIYYSFDEKGPSEWDFALPLSRAHLPDRPGEGPG